MTVAGNTRVLYAAIQSAKGAAATTPTHKFVLTADSFDPGRSVITLPETDAAQQVSPSAVVGSRPVGGWTGWLRSSEFAFLARALMGVNVDAPAASTTATGVNGLNSATINVGSTTGFATSGSALLGGVAFTYTGVTGTSFTGCGVHAATTGGETVATIDTTHTATPSQVLPYLTFWDVVPGSMCTQYVDCRVSSLALSGAALAGISYSPTIVALSAVLNATEPVAPATPASDRALAYPDVTITVGGAAPGTHDAFTLNVQRNVTVLPGDLGLSVYDSVAGIFMVDGTFTRVYVDDDPYNQHHGGSAAASALTRTVFNESFDLLIAESALRSVRFTSAAVEYTETTIPVNVDGTPIIMSRAFHTQRQAAVASNLTIVTKNALATSVASPT